MSETRIDMAAPTNDFDFQEEDSYLDPDDIIAHKFVQPKQILSANSAFNRGLGSCLSLNSDITLYLCNNLDSQAVGLIPSVCAIGAFDGVHLGHRTLISSAVLEAHEEGYLSIGVLFNPDPARLLSPDTAPKDLLSIEDRIRLLLARGLDAVACIAFTPALAALGYQDFFENYLFRKLFCKSIHVGTNFRMGVGGQGDCAAIRSFAKEFECKLHAHELECDLGDTVSSTRIRNLLSQGMITGSTVLLRRAHMVRGHVVHGRGEGTGFGFPTANIMVDTQTCLPKEGVYGCYVGYGEHLWPAAVNVGAPRSFGGNPNTPLLEATLIGFEGNLYGQDLVTFFVSWLRDPQEFDTLEALETTVLGNIDWVRQNLGEGELHD